jgi:hypothetical protein
LTSQEQDNIDAALANIGSDESPISVSDAHTAMEYYLFADSAKAISELSNASLAHLYFVKVQRKPVGYDRMDADEKQTWVNSRMKTIRRRTKKELVEALVEAVRALSSVIKALELTYSIRGTAKESQTTFTSFGTQTRPVKTFLVQCRPDQTVARPGFSVKKCSQKFGTI